MYFKNVNNGQVAYIVDDKLIKLYIKDSNWVKLDSIIEPEFKIINLDNQVKKEELKEKLNRLSEDMIQAFIGEQIPNIEEKKKQFVKLHNELRVLEGKEKRELMNTN